MPIRSSVEHNLKVTEYRCSIQSTRKQFTKLYSAHTCNPVQNSIFYVKHLKTAAQTCDSIFASRPSMMERCPLVGDVVGTSGPSAIGKPRISCTFDLPCAGLTKPLLDTK
jgi:hypothetical protein